MKTIARSAALVALLLVGYLEFYSDGIAKSYGARSVSYYRLTDLDELLRFGADFTKKTESSRAEECRFLLKHQQESPGVGLQLHLMMGRVLSEACGDIPNILRSVESIPRARLPDKRVQQLVAIQTEALRRLGWGAKKLAPAERKQNATHPAPEANDDDARVLRKKLEDIRGIEKNLDETQGDN